MDDFKKNLDMLCVYTEDQDVNAVKKAYSRGYTG